jgi:hypothetical protein
LNLIMPTAETYGTKVNGFPIAVRGWSQMS